MTIWKSKKTKAESVKTTRDGNKADGGSQRVYSYYTASKRQMENFENNNAKRDISPTKHDKKALRKKVIKSFLIILVTIAILGSLILTNPASVAISGESGYRSMQEYQNIVNNALNSDARNKTKLTLQAETIEDDLRKQLPEAVTVSVKAPIIGNQVKVKITTANALAVLLQNSADTMIMDSTGKVINNLNKTVLDSSKLSTIDNQGGLSFGIGDQLFKPEEIASLNSIEYQYTKGEEMAIPYILPSIPREIWVKDAGYYAKFNLDDSSGADPVQQFGALRAVQNKIAAQGAPTPKEYIDVRLGDKVFIK